MTVHWNILKAAVEMSRAASKASENDVINRALQFCNEKYAKNIRWLIFSLRT